MGLFNNILGTITSIGNVHGLIEGVIGFIDLIATLIITFTNFIANNLISGILIFILGLFAFISGLFLLLEFSIMFKALHDLKQAPHAKVYTFVKSFIKSHVFIITTIANIFKFIVIMANNATGIIKP